MTTERALRHRRQGLHLANSDGSIADDADPFQVAHRGPEVLQGIVLGAAIVPNGDRIRPKPSSNLIFGNAGLAEQVVQKLTGTGAVVLAEARFGQCS